jgi:hypothetical protein
MMGQARVFGGRLPRPALPPDRHQAAPPRGRERDAARDVSLSALFGPTRVAYRTKFLEALLETDHRWQRALEFLARAVAGCFPQVSQNVKIAFMLGLLRRKWGDLLGSDLLFRLRLLAPGHIPHDTAHLGFGRLLASGEIFFDGTPNDTWISSLGVANKPRFMNLLVGEADLFRSSRAGLLLGKTQVRLVRAEPPAATK